MKWVQILKALSFSQQKFFIAMCNWPRENIQREYIEEWLLLFSKQWNLTNVGQ